MYDLMWLDLVTKVSDVMFGLDERLLTSDEAVVAADGFPSRMTKPGVGACCSR